MKRLNRKDLCVLLVAMAMTMPALMVFNENPDTWYMNLVGLAYAAWMAHSLQYTRIGRMFCERMERIEDKIFGAMSK